MNDAAADAPVTVVVQTRTREGQGEAFAKWQAGMSATVAAQPGFIEQPVDTKRHERRSSSVKPSGWWKSGLPGGCSSDQ